MATGDVQRHAAEDRLIPPTIYALATGSPPTAIAIVRISGPAAFGTLAKLTGLPLPSRRRLVLRTLRDPVGGAILDSAQVACFPSPASVTGDDLVELHLHGGVAVVAAVLETLGVCGLTMAPRGGFTRRAFDNGKMTLNQIEALGDLISAETPAQHRAALANTGSRLVEQVERWRTSLVEIRATLEATLDFADEDDVGGELTVADRAALTDLRRDFDAARLAGERSGLIRDGVTIAIVGPVNSGKSTLFNALAGRDAAMVSAVAGTTRDVIEARITLGDHLVTLIDTAGIRRTDDVLESEGIRRGTSRAAAAAIVLALGGSTADNTLGIVSKCDVLGRAAGWHDDRLFLSAATGAGLALLEKSLVDRIGALVQPADSALATGRWQAAALASASRHLERALDLPDAVLIAEELRAATVQVEQLIGRVVPEDILDTIFSRFCIGK